MNERANFKTSTCLISITNAMTSLSLHKICQIRLIVRSKLFVHKKAECTVLLSPPIDICSLQEEGGLLILFSYAIHEHLKRLNDSKFFHLNIYS